MKKLIPLAAILVLVGCCASHSQSPPLMPASTAQSSAAHLLIISASYGSGVSFVDVTDRVNDLLHQSNTEFYARPEWLNTDPTPGWNKALVIEYEYQGHRHIFSTGEGGKVSVPELITHATKKVKKRHKT